MARSASENSLREETPSFKCVCNNFDNTCMRAALHEMEIERDWKGIELRIRMAGLLAVKVKEKTWGGIENSNFFRMQKMHKGSQQKEPKCNYLSTTRFPVWLMNIFVDKKGSEPDLGSTVIYQKSSNMNVISAHAAKEKKWNVLCSLFFGHCRLGLINEKGYSRLSISRLGQIAQLGPNDYDQRVVKSQKTYMTGKIQPCA